VEVEDRLGRLSSSGVSRRDLLLLGLGALLLILLVDCLYRRQQVELSVQSQMNLRFAPRAWDAALEKYPRLRPPLYPMLLWVADRAGVPLDRVNEALLLALLGGLAVTFRRALPEVPLAVALLAFAVAHPHYVNLRQYTAEAVFVVALPALVLFLCRYLTSGSWRDLAGAAVSLSVLCLSRYFALSYAFPLVMANVLALAPVPRARRIAHAAAVVVVAGLPVGIWMYFTYLQTGFWTGTDRSAPRQLPEAVQHWAGLTSLPANLRLTGKTLLVDFFSPSAYAAHSVVTRPHSPAPAEWLALGLLAACLVAGAPAWRRRPAWSPRSPTFLVAEFLAAYILVTIVVWTFGNNDPIYTRFLYPAYPLLGILAFAGYRAVKLERPSPWRLLPFRLLLALFLAVQAWRCWQAADLPVRYFS
jgi:hypothetical protein